MINRRKFLLSSSSAFALSQLPGDVYAKNGIKRYKLVAKAAEHTFYPSAQKSKLSLYNQQSPGPTIHCKTHSNNGPQKRLRHSAVVAE